LGQQEIKEILQKYNVIAVVGLSRDKTKPSHEVASYMKNNGYKIVPVNPFADKVLGEKSYKSLLDIPPPIQKTIEIVDIFRPSVDTPKIVEQTIELKKANCKPNVVWMQLGIINERAAQVGRNAGLVVIMDRCIKVEHRRFF
jgi:uncharacterized protein